MTEDSDARRGRERGNAFLSGLRTGRGGRSRSPDGRYVGGGPVGRGGARSSGRFTMSSPLVSKLLQIRWSMVGTYMRLLHSVRLIVVCPGERGRSAASGSQQTYG